MVGRILWSLVFCVLLSVAVVNASQQDGLEGNAGMALEMPPEMPERATIGQGTDMMSGMDMSGQQQPGAEQMMDQSMGMGMDPQMQMQMQMQPPQMQMQMQPPQMQMQGMPQYGQQYEGMMPQQNFATGEVGPRPGSLPRFSPQFSLRQMNLQHPAPFPPPRNGDDDEEAEEEQASEETAQPAAKKSRVHQAPGPHHFAPRYVNPFFPPMHTFGYPPMSLQHKKFGVSAHADMAKAKWGMPPTTTQMEPPPLTEIPDSYPNPVLPWDIHKLYQFRGWNVQQDPNYWEHWLKWHYYQRNFPPYKGAPQGPSYTSTYYDPYP